MTYEKFHKISDNPMFSYKARHTYLHAIFDISQQNEHFLTLF